VKHLCSIILRITLYALLPALLPVTDSACCRLSQHTTYWFRFAVFSLLTAYCILPAVLFAQAGWGPDVRLTYFGGYSYDPRAACCGDTIHIVWWESYAHEEVFYKRSTDAGETWEPDMMLSIEDTWFSIFPQIAAVDNIVHVIWDDYGFGLFYRRSTDGGSTWDDIDSLMPGRCYPSIQASRDTVYVCGSGGSMTNLRFTKSYDGGTSWMPIKVITPANQNPTLRIIAHDIAAIAISYERYGEAYNVRSFDFGEVWSDSQMISDDDGIASQWPAMDTDHNGGIHLTWYDYKYSPYPWTGDILYGTSADSGNTWFDIDSLTVSHRAVASDILAENSNLHLVWEDDRYDFDDNFEIYYRMSADLGQTWGSEVRLTDAINWSRMPSLACDGHYLHLFWSDARDDSNNHISEVYYKRKDLSQGVTEIESSVQYTQPWFEVYPTLFTENITIKQSAWCMEQRGKEQLTNNAPMSYALCTKVYDISGKELRTKRETEMGGIGETVRIDTKALPCGVYFVELQVGNVREVHKVVKVQ
jgi:hypothetical protein